MNDKLIRSIKAHPVKYAHLLGWDRLGDIHDEWIRLMVTEPNDYTLLGHRESYKTTCLSVAIALLIILRPNKTIFFFRKTDDAAAEIVTQVRTALQSDLFKYLVREIYGVDLELTQASYLKIDTNLRSNSKGQCQLQGMGIYGAITGKHADLIFTDDIVDRTDRTSTATRRQTLRAYMELQNIRNRGGRIFNTGTPWHRDDVISIGAEKGGMPNVHRWTCYDTGLFTAEQLEQKRQSMTASLFAANYELKHIADKDALFKKANWLPDTPENRALIFNGKAHVDAAYDGEDTTAYTIFNQLRDGRIIGYGKLWEQHVDRCLPEMRVAHTKYRAGILSCEKNADKGYLASKLSDEYGFITNLYSETMNKHVKIATHLLSNWSRIWWIADTDPDYIDQILNYTSHAEHDDAADSAASLLRYMLSGPKYNSNLRGGV